MFKKIVVAYDGSSCSEEALKRAINFIEQDPETQLHIINVMDEIPPTIYGLYGPNLTKKVLEEFEEAADQLLRNAKTRVAKYVDNCSFGKVQGNPAEEIVNYAEENDIDLIIIGSRGYGAVKGMLLGSVSSRVVQQADCNVLVIK